jgi:hypothetical protein
LATVSLYLFTILGKIYCFKWACQETFRRHRVLEMDSSVQSQWSMWAWYFLWSRYKPILTCRSQGDALLSPASVHRAGKRIRQSWYVPVASYWPPTELLIFDASRSYSPTIEARWSRLRTCLIIDSASRYRWGKWQHRPVQEGIIPNHVATTRRHARRRKD